MSYRSDGATPRQRFDEKVGPPDANGCRLWTGGRTRSDALAYGLFYADGQMRPAHRWLLEQHLGRKLEPGIDACHKCDVRLCVEISHLFSGTRGDNMRDAAKKGRTDRTRKPKGEAHGRATITDAQVLAMRASAGLGQSIQQIAREFDTSYMTAYRVVNRETWKHI